MNLIHKLAKTYNNLNIKHIEGFLSKDVIYESQNVLEPIQGRENLINYLTQKFETIKKSNNLVYAELGYLDAQKEKACIILSQGEKENEGALVLIESADNLITRIDICTVAPH
ncbi:hypothetical protein H9I45_15215 [Polaribacter haliotis]|uniref:Nuclear transport factor 2 family protein n=1 Tax=Polaribacter haliotis TaxID=1888915 RepID=A0A7L8AFS6_9FLAO|nr:hypothetical protein [Polaribacter haliotis]QOD60669.1 hypothetical protein H9I45_15215 [Polaribacter haliotis]